MLLFCLLIFPWIIRWFYFPEQSLRDLKHPITGQFYATMPIGCLVLAVDFLVVGIEYIGREFGGQDRQGLLFVSMEPGLAIRHFAITTPIINFFNRVLLLPAGLLLADGVRQYVLPRLYR
ncbi:hypothetical protein [Thermacetogenium phaeum]|uniref:SLAC1 family transporter n=1 Tax=Thermacetogenium phaeum TaxID=85874 RepID=UPI0024A86599|nr:hypothetical protein [Thermacetogenium phaeum]